MHKIKKKKIFILLNRKTYLKQRIKPIIIIVVFVRILGYREKLWATLYHIININAFLKLFTLTHKLSCKLL